MHKNTDDKFSKKETEERMKAALRGARIAGPKHKSGPKRKFAKVAKRNKAKTKPGD